MDVSLFQFGLTVAVNEQCSVALADARIAHRSGPRAYRTGPIEKVTANSANLDLLRSVAVLLVVGFHVAKFLNWRLGSLRVTDFGLLGVMLFFVHTTVVLMFSLERQSAEPLAPVFIPFMVRRCFRIYPLAIVVVMFVFVFQIPSDLQFGAFHLFHQSLRNLLANLLLIQNVARETANPGVLWSLPLELQMYLALPALFIFASRVKSSWGLVAFWWLVVGLWFVAGLSSGLLPLSERGIRSPMEALLKFTRFAPCFLPGIVAYKLWRQPRLFPAAYWPAFLGLCCAAYLWGAGSQPLETGWFICFAIGVGLCFFREMPQNSLTWLTKRIARYSYGIYLLHYFAIWMAFVLCARMNFALQTTIFVLALISLPVLLYHTLEAPLIILGVRVSKKLKDRSFGISFKGHSSERAQQICSD